MIEYGKLKIGDYIVLKDENKNIIKGILKDINNLYLVVDEDGKESKYYHQYLYEVDKRTYLRLCIEYTGKKVRDMLSRGKITYEYRSKK